MRRIVFSVGKEHPAMMNMFKTLFGGASDSSSVKIEVDSLSTSPTKLWNKIKSKQTVKRLEPLDPNTPIADDKLRFVCISDTHAQIENGRVEVPPGDVLLHAGDLTNVGQPQELYGFNEYLGTLPHRHKVIIAGNHDLTMDDYLMNNKVDYLQGYFGVDVKKVRDYLKEKGVDAPRDLLTNCIYLEDAYVTISGVKIFGSPWQPEFGGWGFNLQRGKPCLEKWNMIPDDTDILITHGPPLGHGDKCFDGQMAGCMELLSTIQKRVKPKYHIFGHIHEGYGVTTDDVTTYINASTCTLRYKPVQPPIVFDFPIPEGQSKESAISSVVCCRPPDDASSAGVNQTVYDDAAEKMEDDNDEMDVDTIVFHNNK